MSRIGIIAACAAGALIASAAPFAAPESFGSLPRRQKLAHIKTKTAKQAKAAKARKAQRLARKKSR